MNELRAILDELTQIRAGDEPAVLATVVRVLGSAYRGIGARRLINRDGPAIGLVSGGCLEADIARQAWRLTEGGKAALIRYDSVDSDGEWTFGLGCRGTIDILLERIDGTRPTAWINYLRAHLDEHEPSVLARVLASDAGTAAARLGSFLAVGSSAAPIHDLASPDLAGRLAAAARDALRSGRSGHATLATDAGRVTALLEVIEPPPTLLACGVGPDVLPLVRMARELGWHIAVIAGRNQAATRGRFAAADEVLTLADEGRIRALASHRRAAAVLMTHNIGEDARFLDLLVRSSVGYIGLLGPKHRADRLLDRLDPLDASTRIRLHAPVGLDLGAETPAEIALSIMAEIQAELAGRSGGPLRDRGRPIHDRSDHSSLEASSTAMMADH